MYVSSDGNRPFGIPAKHAGKIGVDVNVGVCEGVTVIVPVGEAVSVIVEVGV